MAAEHPLLAEALASLDRAVIEASEAEEKLDAASDALSFDPARLDSIETRLFDLRGLARKHRVEPAQLGALYREMTEQLTRMPAGEEGPHRLGADLAAQAGASRPAAEPLPGQRREAASRPER